MDIVLCQSGRTLEFARSELIWYLTRTGCPALHIELSVAQADEMAAAGLPAVADPSLDDQYLVHVENGLGFIKGINQRSVLLGVYRYLTLIGCRVLRPGREWEIIPTLLTLSDYDAGEARTASLRHRGACIEGADSIQNILDFIDWSPKIGFNSFFLQFETPQIFLDRWYNHIDSPMLKPAGWTIEDSRRILPALDAAIKTRGMIEHRVGHGWTSKVLGCSATGWDSEGKDLDEKTRPLAAMVNGKRGLYYGVPTNTNLCLSNPEAVEKFADQVVRYAAANPTVDYIHIWLADDANNSCECDQCRSKRPSDHYMDLLNRIDQKLTAAGSRARLVILLYVDLLWAPIQSKLNDPDRFVLMFAPITRTFEKSYADHGDIPDEPEFKLNHLKFPSDIESNLRFLKDWEKAAPTDAFVYDYYMGRAHYGDPTYVNLSRVMWKDLEYNQHLGLNGINSCQELRAQFPNGLADYVMARTSLDQSLTFDDIAKEYYSACYGEDGEKVFKIMSDLSDCFSTDYIMKIGPRVNEDLANRLDRVPALLGKLSALITTHVSVQFPVQQRMWDLLGYFVSYIDILSRILQLSASDQPDEADIAFQTEYKPFVWNLELEDQAGFDTYRSQEILGRAIDPQRP